MKNWCIYGCEDKDNSDIIVIAESVLDDDQGLNLILKFAECSYLDEVIKYFEAISFSILDQSLGKDCKEIFDENVFAAWFNIIVHEMTVLYVDLPDYPYSCSCICSLDVEEMLEKYGKNEDLTLLVITQDKGMGIMITANPDDHTTFYKESGFKVFAYPLSKYWSGSTWSIYNSLVAYEEMAGVGKSYLKNFLASFCCLVTNSVEAVDVNFGD